MNLKLFSPSSWKDYEVKFTGALTELKKVYNLTHAVFGDIDLEDHKTWEEKVAAIERMRERDRLIKASRDALPAQIHPKVDPSQSI